MGVGLLSLSKGRGGLLDWVGYHHAAMGRGYHHSAMRGVERSGDLSVGFGTIMQLWGRGEPSFHNGGGPSSIQGGKGTYL